MFTPTRSERGRPWRVVRIVGLVLLAVAVGWAAILAGLWAYAWMRLGADQIPVFDDEVAALGVGGASAPAGATTVLVALTGPVDPTIPRPSELVAPLVMVQFGGPRSDPAALVLAQELEVSVDGAGTMSLGEVQLEGGPDLLVRSVVDYTGVRVDHVVSASVDALPRMVAALDGVEVCGADGCRQTTPEQLRVAMTQSDDREVVGLISDTLRAIAGHLDVSWVARSPVAAKRMIDAVSEEVSTDVSLRGLPLLGLADVLDAWSGSIDVDAVPLVVNPANDRVVPLEEPAAIRFQHLREGTPFSGEDTDDAVADLLAQVEVAVLNGAGVDGLASRVRSRLEAAGFTVVTTGNAPAFDRDASVIHYAQGDPDVEYVAVLLAEELDGASLEPLDVQPVVEGEPVDVLVTAAADIDD